MNESTHALVLGGGCFWCLEAAFKVLPGVRLVVSGYAGGRTNKPSYDEVCSGATGHAEVVRIEFDPAQIGLERLFELFFIVHDPTTRDRQGADFGTQYRSIVLYADEAQRMAAVKAIATLGARLSSPVVTEVAPLGDFWPAEDYHQDYFEKNPNYGYCRAVVAPKRQKALAFVQGSPAPKRL